MTKKETAIFNDKYNKALEEYEKCVISGKFLIDPISDEALHCACAFSELLRESLFSKADSEVGA